MGGEAGRLELPEPVLEVECAEPDGTVVRAVRPARLDFERLGFLWNKLREFDVLFNDYIRGDFEAFVNQFVVEIDGEPTSAGLLWDVDDVGILFLDEIKPLESAQAHFVFWDGRFKGRAMLIQEMIGYVFEKYNFQRISVEVPLYANDTMHFVEGLGFFCEGRKRNATLYKGEWFDVNLYSALPGEIVPGLFEVNKLYKWERVLIKRGGKDGR